MNRITLEQNSEKQLQRLAAQRQLYATAKTVFGWQIFIGGPVAVAAAFWVAFNPSAKGYVAAWGIAVALCDLVWLAPWQKRLRDSAARIQEAFDCDVLELPWSKLKAGEYPDPELVKEQSGRYEKWKKEMPPLENWYSVAVAELPLHVARLACQRSNCWWDSKQRRRYANWIIFIVMSIFAVVLGLSLKGGLTIEDFILKVAASLAPAFLIGIRQFLEQTEAATRLDKLRAHSETIWNDALARTAKADVTALSRSLQDEILENRRKSPLVFDKIFKGLRRDYEIQMTHGVAYYVDEAKKRLKIG